MPCSVAEPILQQMTRSFEAIRALGKIANEHVIEPLLESQWKAPAMSAISSDLSKLKEELKVQGFERVAAMIDKRQSMMDLHKNQDISSDEDDLSDSHRVYEELEPGVQSRSAIKQLTSKPHKSPIRRQGLRTRLHTDDSSVGNQDTSSENGTLPGL